MSEGKEGKRGLASDPFVHFGLLLLLGGMAAVGIFLSAAGAHSLTMTVVFGVVMAVCFTVGCGVLTVSARRRGGVLNARPTRAEHRNYRARYRGKLD
jgi:hypothetical protein